MVSVAGLANNIESSLAEAGTTGAASPSLAEAGTACAASLFVDVVVVDVFVFVVVCFCTGKSDTCGGHQKPRGWLAVSDLTSLATDAKMVIDHIFARR